jgi:hypothetical protein
VLLPFWIQKQKLSGQISKDDGRNHAQFCISQSWEESSSILREKAIKRIL